MTTINIAIKRFRRTTTTKPFNILHKLGWSLEQWDIIDYLKDNPESPFQTLAESIEVSGTSLSRSLNNLIWEYLVNQTRLPENNGKRILSLTKNGKAFHKRYHKRLNKSMGITRKEINKLLSDLLEFEND